MQPFIRVTEIWVPDATGRTLELADGAYGPLEEFRVTSARTSFGFGEGLPGKAWQLARPVVLKHFDETTFQRTEAAQQVGLTAGVAMPVFAGEFIKAVLVFLCGDVNELSGAIEVWQDDGHSGMGLVEGYYGDMERFEWLSKSIRFPRGRGLPGAVWETGMPQILGDLANSNSFLRAPSAAAAGITTGIGIPLDSGSSGEDISSVMTFLSSKGTPIAKRFEVWRRDGDGQYLSLESGIGDDVLVEPAQPDCRIAKGHRTIGMVWASGIPAIGNAVKSESRWHSTDTRYDGLETLLAIPVILGGRLASVVVLYN